MFFLDLMPRGAYACSRRLLAYGKTDRYFQPQRGWRIFSDSSLVPRWGTKYFLFSFRGLKRHGYMQKPLRGSTSMLKMKPSCEKCKSSLTLLSEAYICSYECTFCKTCTESMSFVCPNCSGKLVLRPTREKKPVRVVLDRVKKYFS